MYFSHPKKQHKEKQVFSDYGRTESALFRRMRKAKKQKAKNKNLLWSMICKANVVLIPVPAVCRFDPHIQTQATKGGGGRGMGEWAAGRGQKSKSGG